MLIIFQLRLFILAIYFQQGFCQELKNENFCLDYEAQKDFAMNSVLGEWRIIEVVHHQRAPWQGSTNLITLKQCPTLKISIEPSQELKIVWNETIVRPFYYKGIIKDIRNPGYLDVIGSHDDVFLGEVNYNDAFFGVIQVMEAAPDHVVLTFCTRKQTEIFLFTIVLAKKDNEPPPESLVSVRRLLRGKGLPPVLITKTCSNNAARVKSVLLFQVLFTMIWKFYF